MTDTKDLIREIQEHTDAHGGENTATHLLVQAVMALQRQADELAAIGAGGVEPLRKINQPEPTVPDQTQDWAGMDGATAYLLIQRHADNWADAAKMMGEWLDANQRQSFTAADMATASAQGFRDGVASAASWISVDARLPEPNTPVLLDIGKKFTIRALWAEKHTVRVCTDADDCGEYDEETDEYYCPEGWYEWNEHEEVHWAVIETPRAWRELPTPLPAAPGPADGREQ